AAPAATPAAAPTPTPAPEPWRFVVLGDTRTSGLRPPEAMYRIVERAAAARPDAVLIVGDLIDALENQASVREQWRHWRAAVAPLGAKHVLPTPGNHDVRRNAWATDLMVEAFPELPRNGPPGYEGLTYALDYGGVRFISLHSEVFGDPHHLGEAQLAWLEVQLRENPNRYTIVFSHDPAFPVGPHVGSSLDVYPAERDRLWALLREHNATAYIAGHEHLYNRQEIDGVTQIIAGTSGSWPYGGFGGDFQHYVVAEVREDGIAFTVYDIDGVTRDSFVLNAKR
ncbi:MAG TPA: metallophosphoesterase, partial [Roseiflexaceae bacterium]|nr:metallophosphoesterase [Roseiflexaceae bacterium]